MPVYNVLFWLLVAATAAMLVVGMSFGGFDVKATGGPARAGEPVEVWDTTGHTAWVTAARPPKLSKCFPSSAASAGPVGGPGGL